MRALSAACVGAEDAVSGVAAGSDWCAWRPPQAETAAARAIHLLRFIVPPYHY
jgi:hypothetical protein